MKKSKFTEEQITHALAKVERGTAATEVCREGTDRALGLHI